jgi:TrpR-related protein YerC/YecD
MARWKGFDRNGPDTPQLYRAVLALRDLDECFRFFHDLWTPGEEAMMTRRFTLARLLHEDHPYREIQARTGASSATVRRAAHELRAASPGGFRLVLERLHTSEPE